MVSQVMCSRCDQQADAEFFGDVDNKRVTNLQDNGKEWCWDCLGKYIGKMPCGACRRFFLSDDHAFTATQLALGMKRQCNSCCDGGAAYVPRDLVAPPPKNLQLGTWTLSGSEPLQTRLPSLSGKIEGDPKLIEIDYAKHVR